MSHEGGDNMTDEERKFVDALLTALDVGDIRKRTKDISKFLSDDFRLNVENCRKLKDLTKELDFQAQLLLFHMEEKEKKKATA